MSDKMLPIPFDEMLRSIKAEYEHHKTIYGVPVERDVTNVPIGPAAGPHTQLAVNLVCSYAAGAAYFELKTVQHLEGAELGIVKPCIYVAHEVYNTEWSTELAIHEARDEYIKAYLLIYVLSKEYHLRDISQIHFIMSVGYDLEGIQSSKVDQFLNTMLHASGTKEWNRDLTYLEEHLDQFTNITYNDLTVFRDKDTISDTVTLSTMHGCRADEIEKIAVYLLKEKGLNTYIKMNPTLPGKEKVRKLLDDNGYQDISFRDEIFKHDITLDQAEQIIRNCQKAARKNHRKFGIKLTNTFPVRIKHGELAGEEMYLSGPALYPISILAAYEIAKRLDGNIPISYSGGVDKNNIKELLETGIAPITVSSYLLKPGGYQNLSKLKLAGKSYQHKDNIDLTALQKAVSHSGENELYNWKEANPFHTKEPYHELCGRCRNCVDVCPNRANIAIEYENTKYVLHRDRLCNECGCCSCECIMGHQPYIEKLTVFEKEEAYYNSKNDGVFINDSGNILSYRKGDREQEAPKLYVTLLKKMKKEGRL